MANALMPERPIAPTYDHPAAFTLDRRAARAAVERAADGYDAAAAVAREIADRMLTRLDLVKLAPATVLDAGCGTGYCARVLAQRYRGARVIGLDIAGPMLRYARRNSGWLGPRRYVTGDIQKMPLPTGSIDLVVSNLALPWCDVTTAFAESLRVLRPGGLFMFTMLGPDTLHELRAAWNGLDAHTHVHGFFDMHDLGDALVRAGYGDPVMDVERLTLTYPSVRALLHELQALGVHNVTHGRARGLTGRHRFARFIAAYEAQARNDRIPASVEVVYGHAWGRAQAPRAPDSNRRVIWLKS